MEVLHIVHLFLEQQLSQPTMKLQTTHYKSQITKTQKFGTIPIQDNPSNFWEVSILSSSNMLISACLQPTWFWCCTPFAPEPRQLFATFWVDSEDVLTSIFGAGLRPCHVHAATFKRQCWIVSLSNKLYNCHWLIFPCFLFSIPVLKQTNKPLKFYPFFLHHWITFKSHLDEDHNWDSKFIL